VSGVVFTLVGVSVAVSLASAWGALFSQLMNEFSVTILFALRIVARKQEAVNGPRLFGRWM
jgi:hypothetical protein